jgi:hypothetical protein
MVSSSCYHAEVLKLVRANGVQERVSNSWNTAQTCAHALAEGVQNGHLLYEHINYSNNQSSLTR